MGALIGIIAAVLIGTFWSSFRVLKEYERGVVFRLGRVRPLRGPGVVFLIPFGVERMERVSLRIIAMDIPPQDVITRDNVSVKVNAVLYFRVSDPDKAILEIEDFLFATSQLAQTTLRSVIGQAELDEVLAEREKFNQILRDIIDDGTDAWGIDVTGVEVKDVDLPQEMKRVIARQAEAERERRAKVINAEGEFQAADRLRQAAQLLSQEPASLQLRFLQTASEIAAENNSTTLFPLPVDLFEPLRRAFGTSGGGGASEAGTPSPEEAAEAAIPGAEEEARLGKGEEGDARRLGAGAAGEADSAGAASTSAADEPRPEAVERGDRPKKPIEERIDKKKLAEEARRRVQGDG